MIKTGAALLGAALWIGVGLAAAAPPIAYRGVNLSGAEFKSSKLPGKAETDYTYPKPAQVDRFIGKGMNTFRLPFLWERVQPTLSGDLDAAELARIDTFVATATAKGAVVVLDVHNYARYRGKVVGQQDVPAAAFADLWKRLAVHFKGNDKVVFGLMNEPHGMPTELWRDDANAAIAAIRAVGAHNLVLVPGNGYTGAGSWAKTYYGTPNAEVMLGIVDPRNHYAYEVHQYLDDNSSGTSDQCVSASAGSQRLAGFTAWLRTHGRRGFLGEFAGGRNNTCIAALDDMLTHIDQNADVWLGWTYWAAGTWWGDYMFTLEPTGCPDQCTDRPQMQALAPHLDAP